MIPGGTRFIGISESVNLTERKSAGLNAETEPYTMDDITSTVKPYKVYTALLTQSGGDDLLGLEYPNLLVVGITYKITDSNANTCDFTNVGAPDNNEGTSFIATGTIPNSWGETNNAILDYNTGAPVATVLENTIGNVWFGYNDVGSYFFNSNGVFTENSTIGFITFNDCCEFGLGEKPILAINVNSTINNIVISSALDGIYSNSVIQNTPIEIRVYS